jgi:hypothetical protein
MQFSSSFVYNLLTIAAGTTRPGVGRCFLVSEMKPSKLDDLTAERSEV